MRLLNLSKVKEEIYFIAPLPSVRKRTRLAKMVPYFLDAGFDIVMYGWERERGEKDKLSWNDSRVSENIILKGGGYVSVKARLMYPIWMALVFLKVLSVGRKKTFFCLGWETAFPARLAGAINGARIIFDDADRFSMVVKMPLLFRRVVEALEKWTSYNVFLHIVPGLKRYDWKHDKMIILRNTPLKKDFVYAESEEIKEIEGDMVIYANGWVGQTRGAPVFLEVMKKLLGRGSGIVMIIAGRVDSKEGHELTKLPNVEFYGELPQKEALLLYRSSDLVLTFYDPNVEINKKAESNKWGDCVYFSVPFVVNSEVETAEEFLRSGAAWSVPYSDADSLASLLLDLSKNKKSIFIRRNNIKKKRKEFPIFDDQMIKILKCIRVG